VPITIECPSCKKTLKAPDHFAGKRAKCPGCQIDITVPGGNVPPPLPPTPPSTPYHAEEATRPTQTVECPCGGTEFIPESEGRLRCEHCQRIHIIRQDGGIAGKKLDQLADAVAQGNRATAERLDGLALVISRGNEMTRDMLQSQINSLNQSLTQTIPGSPQYRSTHRALAVGYLKQKLWSKALAAFEKAMDGNEDDPEIFFGAAICLLGGKEAFLAQRSTINKIEQYLETALSIAPKGVYYYFWAYIKCDYYHAKNLKTSPSYRELLSTASGTDVTSFDIDQLYHLLGVARPDPL
jgi:Zn finger protein HypA/HybF involved in hydrogenase expression